MHIYLQELKQNCRALLTWMLIIAAYCIFYISLFPTVARIGMEELIASYPEALLAAFDLQVLDMTEILGYYAMEGHLVVLLFGGIFATLLAGNILAREESEKTIEFLYAKPVTRSQIVTGKLLSLLTYVLILNLVIHAVTYISMLIVHETSFDQATFWNFALASVLVHAVLAALGLLISSLLSKSKNVLSIAVGISLVTYGLDIISKMAEKVKFLRFLSPFHYGNAADILQKGGLETERIIILAGASLAAIALTYWIYNRKDFAA